MDRIIQIQKSNFRGKLIECELVEEFYRKISDKNFDSFGSYNNTYMCKTWDKALFEKLNNSMIEITGQHLNEKLIELEKISGEK